MKCRPAGRVSDSATNVTPVPKARMHPTSYLPHRRALRVMCPLCQTAVEPAQAFSGRSLVCPECHLQINGPSRTPVATEPSHEWLLTVRRPAAEYDRPAARRA